MCLRAAMALPSRFGTLCFGGTFSNGRNASRRVEVMTLRSKALLLTSACAAIGAIALFSVADGASVPAVVGYGPNPTLPAPQKTVIPNVNITPARPWTANEMPVAEAGFEVAAFARGLNHPRWIYILPSGDVLVAVTNGPGEPTRSVKGWIMKRVMARAGSAVESPNRIILLRDTDGDGVAETRTVFLQGL